MPTPFGFLEFGSAVLVASLLGSMHCVGMCGPFVALATATSTDRSHRASVFARLTAYHFGRLTTYLLLGVVAGGIAHALGHSELLSRSNRYLSLGGLVGGAILAIGVWRVFQEVRLDGTRHLASASNQHAPWVTRWGQWLAKIRKKLRFESPVLNAYFWGLTTTLLPCGWLYLFVLAALAASTVGMAVLTMVAFWLGTLPFLSAAAWAWRLVGERFRGLSGPLATLSILGMGLYLLFSRSLLDTADWNQNKISASDLRSRTVILESPPQSRSDVIPPPPDETPLEFLARVRNAINEGLPCCTEPVAQPGANPSNRAVRSLRSPNTATRP